MAHQSDLSSLYRITDFTYQNQEVTAGVELNPDHLVFMGHFPGQPVLPGVCMVHISKEIATRACAFPCRLVKTGQVKFLRPLVPPFDSLIRFKGSLKTDGEVWKFSVEAYRGETLHFSFQGEFTDH